MTWTPDTGLEISQDETSRAKARLQWMWEPVMSMRPYGLEEQKVTVGQNPITFAKVGEMKYLGLHGSS